MISLYNLKDNFLKYNTVKSELIIYGNVSNPEISIFIPTYKRAKTLKETIDSAINQITDCNYEIVIINNDPNGADGETTELIRSYKSEKIYYYVNNENIGLCGNWNRGIEMSRGSYVAMIHDDDLLSPYFIDAIRNAIDYNNKPGIIGVDYYNFTSSSIPKFSKPEKMAYRKVTTKSFFFGRYINIAGMTVKKDLIFKLGGYAEEYYPNEDTILIGQSTIFDSVININFPLAGYRKEINLSLKPGIMESIISLTEETRRDIANHEKFAKLWMFFFDKEFLYAYIRNANRTWNLDVDYKPIMNKFGLSQESPSGIKMFLLKLCLKIQRLEMRLRE